MAFCLSRVTTHRMPRVYPSNHSAPALAAPNPKERCSRTPDSASRPRTFSAPSWRSLTTRATPDPERSVPPSLSVRRRERREGRRDVSLLSFRTPLAANLRYGMARQQTAVYRKVAARWPRLFLTPEGDSPSRAALTRSLSPRRRSSTGRRGSTTSGQIIPMSYTQSVSSLGEPS